MLSEKEKERLTRADQLQAAMAILKQEIQEILLSGEVAPPGCRVMRYRVRRKKACYWYYKLQALEPTFPPPSGSGELRGVQAFRKSWQSGSHRSRSPSRQESQN